jgi:cobalamin synthase
MMALLRSIAAAFAFLTRLPVPARATWSSTWG